MIVDVSVVREYFDVLLEDFLGLPSKNQVEFRIDLVSGAASMTKIPYRLAPPDIQ